MSRFRHTRATVAALLVTLFLLIVAGPGRNDPDAPPVSLLPAESYATPEVSPQMLPLPSPLDGARAELSGLAWYDRWLLLLPQYPDFAGEPALYAISRDELTASVSDPEAPLSARTIPLRGIESVVELPGYEGFEAIAVSGNSLFFLVELRASPMRTAVVRARIAGDMSAVDIEAVDEAALPAPTRLANLGYEALVASSDGKLLSLYEANGVEPAGFQFTTNLAQQTPLTVAPLAYRLTDATAPDAQGRFWVSNYFFPGERALTDPEARGGGVTHQQFAHVERLIEMQWTPRAVARTATPPLYLRLADSPRNWEGMVRFDHDAQRGFLLVTDKYPTSLLAYVAAPSSRFIDRR